MKTPRKILFLMSGSISAFKACDLISRLVKAKCEVQVAASKSLGYFIGNATLEGLTGKPVIDSSFLDGHAMDHIELTRWCDIAILCPATAHTINGLAAGTAEDPIGTIALAFDLKSKDFYIAPAMNTKMYENFATQKSLETLNSAGFKVLPTSVGTLACGEYGEGRLLEPEQIFNILIPKSSEKSKLKILVTAGGTKEPIDGVRFIGNTSTGKTGAELTDILSSAGHFVKHLCPKDAVLPKNASDLSHFSSFEELESSLKVTLDKEHFDWVIHSAAVSDFSLAEVVVGETNRIAKDKTENKISVGKIESTEDLKLTLRPNKKLITQLREWSLNKSIKVIGFKLTNTEDRSNDWNAVNKIFKSSPQVEFVVHNDLLEFKDKKSHPFTIFDKNKKETKVSGSKELGMQIKELL